MFPMKSRTLFIAALLLFLVIPSKGIADSGNDLILNYIESRPADGQYAYDVSALFSLQDSIGNPIKDLKIENIALSEDGRGITLDSLDLVQDEPIYLSLLLDTSGSMIGTKIEAARVASKSFTTGLNTEDRLSITTFNSDITHLTDFSTDHTAAVSLLAAIDAIPQSGTCLYDAAYEAIQRTAALPLGRRAVIILTDGKDELITGGACSKLILDDVIDLASEGSTRVPVYTIGLGNSIDVESLTRLAELTGGQFQRSPDAAQLESLFVQLLDQLQSQYILHYTSTAAPGSHNLVMQVNYLNANLTDSRGFMLQALPINLSIISPSNGQEINGKVKVVAAITGQGHPIKQVVFSANGVTIGTVDKMPYELEWVPDPAFNGDVSIRATAMSAENNTLAEGTVQVKVIVSGVVIPGVIKTESGFFTNKKTLLYGGLLAVIVLCLVIYFILAGKKRRNEKQRDKKWNEMVGNSNGLPAIGMNEMTMDGFVLGENSLGALMVMQSDDPAMLGQRFEITDNSTRLGRAADNEILFPKDGPVSRHHAIIENQNGQLVLSEMVSTSADGTSKTPTFGTFINDQQIRQPVVLRSGDLIRLGKRLVLKFECTNQNDEDDDARTMDQLTLDDNDKTMDSI